MSPMMTIHSIFSSLPLVRRPFFFRVPDFLSLRHRGMVFLLFQGMFLAGDKKNTVFPHPGKTARVAAVINPLLADFLFFADVKGSAFPRRGGFGPGFSAIQGDRLHHGV